MSVATQKNTRRAERISTKLPVRVEALESGNKLWRELTLLKSVSKNGADFYLNHLFEVGQLLFLTIPLEKQMRVYDRNTDQYCIWGIVRHCHQALIGRSKVYHIGVAFVGREPPFGYRKEPTTIYKLGELNENGLWNICEEYLPSATRKHPRYLIPIEIYLAVFDAEENIVAHEKTVTENISAVGASVFSGLDLNIGDSVRVIKQHSNFSVAAIVRDRRVGNDNLPRLHLEFINAQFPLEGIET